MDENGMRTKTKNRFALYYIVLLLRQLSYNLFYYIDVSVLLENNQWHIFHILTSEDIDDVIYCFCIESI